MNTPEYVEITDVCLRDGLQNLKELVPTDRKFELAKRIVDAGVQNIEITSFVSPKWIPQMADAEMLIPEVKAYAKGKKVKLICLIPNLRGMERAVDVGVDGVTYVVSVSRKHNMNNVNRTPEASLKQISELKKIQPSNMKLCLALATSFGCPFGEEITAEKVSEAARIGIENGADEIMLADTIGSADPVMIENVVGAILKIAPADKIKLHLHDTLGMALANYVTALQMGIYRFESSVGGLGGCPYAPGASGNAATEDVNNMLLAMGIRTGIAQERLIEAVKYIDENIPSRISDHVWAKIAGKCSEK